MGTKNILIRCPQTIFTGCAKLYAQAKVRYLYHLTVKQIIPGGIIIYDS